MASDVLFGLSWGQLEAFAHAVEVGKTDFDDAGADATKRAGLAKNLTGFIRSCQEIPRVLRQHRDGVLDLIAARALDNYNETGQELHRSFERGRQVLEEVIELTRRFQDTGGFLIAANTLTAALEEINGLEAAFFEHWPNFTSEDVQEARKAFERGECVSLDNAFAGIKGVSEEAWIQLVAKRKSQLQA